MAKAKQTKPEPKQIVLTKEQYEALCKILNTIDESTDQIAELALEDHSKIQLGYNLGMINNDLQRAYNTLDELTDEVNPSNDGIDWTWGEDEDEN